MAATPVRTWCCNTPSDGPHREGCDFEPREDNPIDYAGPVVTDPAPPQSGEKTSAPRLTGEEIRQMVLDITGNKYFLGSSAPVEDWPMIFLPIGLGGLANVDIDTIGMVAEEWDKAGDRSINGYPIFLSCKIIHVDDWAVIVEKVQATVKAIHAVLDEMDPPAAEAGQ